ncbi:MAG TPA: hypothetical protein VFS49_12680 [Croceibacterium sp.]|nr:hypothetical protein [Croceibacterium sp.]
MLAITVSLLFALAAAAALAVLRSSLLVGCARARLILAELAEIDRQARASRPAPALLQPRPALAAA